jgi:hypothetical protein
MVSRPGSGGEPGIAFGFGEVLSILSGNKRTEKLLLFGIIGELSSH